MMARPIDTETTPLLAPTPTASDASIEASIDASSHEDSVQHGDEDVVSHSSTGNTLHVQLWTSAIALGVLIFLQATNISLLTTIASPIADDLGVFCSTSWFTSSYLIAMSSLAPLNGKLAAVFSPRYCIFVGSLLLAFGTLICGLSTSFIVFILGRVLTGIGASNVFTVSTIIVLEMSSIKRRGLSIGFLNTGYTIGVAMGAILAGAMLPHTGWRWCFLAQSPLSILAGFTLLVAMPAQFSRSTRSPKSMSQQLRRLDYLGAATLTATIVLVLIPLSSSGPIPIIPLVIAPITLSAFILIEIRVANDPIIPISLLQSRGLLFTCLGTVGYMMARWTVLFYTPVYIIALRSWSPASAGAVLIPTNLGFALGGVSVGWLHIRRHGSFYWSTLLTFAVFPMTLVWLASLSVRSSPMALFVLDVFICGFVTGASLNYSLAHALHLTPKSTHYIVTSLLATFRGFSGSFGSAVGGGIFSRALDKSLRAGFADHGLDNEAELIRRLLGAPALVQELDGLKRQIAVSSYEYAFQTLFVAGAGLAAVTVIVQASTGWKAASEEATQEEADTGTQESHTHV